MSRLQYSFAGAIAGFLFMSLLPWTGAAADGVPSGLFATVSSPEIKLNAGINPVGAPDKFVRAYSRPDGRICVLHLEGFHLRALLSSDGGETFDRTVDIPGGEIFRDVFWYETTETPGGTIYAVLEVGDPAGGRNLAVVRSEDGGFSWSRPVPILPENHPSRPVVEGNIEQRTFAVAANDEGFVCVAFWSHGISYWAACSTDFGDTWGEPVRLDVPTGQWFYGRDLDVVVSRTGGSVCVAYTEYRQWPEKLQGLWISRSSDGGATFQEESAATFVPDAHEIYNADLAAANDGAFLLSFYGMWDGGSSGGLVVLRSTDGGWTFDPVVAKDLGFPYLTPDLFTRLAVAPQGVTLLLLTGNGNYGSLGVYRSNDNGVSFGPNQELASNELSASPWRGVRVTRATDGTWGVAWSAYAAGGSGTHLRLRRSLDDGVTWPAAMPVDSNGGRPDGFDLVAGKQNDFVVVFSDRRNYPGRDLYGTKAPAIWPEFPVERRLDDDAFDVGAPVYEFDGVTLASDAVSHLYALFAASGEEHLNFYVSRSADEGRTFETTPLGPYESGRQLAAGPDGHVYVATVAREGWNTWVRVRHSEDFGRTWSEEGSLIPGTSIRPETLRLAALPGGRAFVIWAENVWSYSPRVRLARTSDGGSTFDVTTLQAGDLSDPQPAICAGGETVVAVWNSGRWGSVETVATTSTDQGETFSDREILRPNDGSSPQRLRVVCSAEGPAFAAWYDTRESYWKPEIRGRAFRGGVWMPEAVVSSGFQFIPFELEGAFLDREGERILIVARAIKEDGSEVIWSALSRDGGSSFPAQRNLDDAAPVPESLSAYPRIAADGEENAWVFWMDGSVGSQPTIAVRRSPDGGESWGSVKRMNTEKPQGAYWNVYWNVYTRWSPATAALPGIGFVGWTGQRESFYDDALVNADRADQPPVADAGEDQTIECTGDLEATARLDGSGSYDPDSTPEQSDIASYAWAEGGLVLAETETAEVPFLLGEHDVLLTVTDRAGAADSDGVVMRVQDTLPPDGGITAPEEGSCHGEAVDVRSDFTDVCDPEPDVAYEPGPGPVYDTHGDHEVTVTATDQAGNAASDSVRFTVDLVPPEVSWQLPDPAALLVPEGYPLDLFFTSSDEDGAAGGVTHEAIFLDGCPAYDGSSYGDGDGLLSDETVVMNLAELCHIATACGFAELVQPVLRIEATDCGGNVGSDQVRLPGSLKLVPGVCTP